MASQAAQFRYHVSLRIVHPEIDPDEMTLALGLTPRFVERKGETVKHRVLRSVPDEVVKAYYGNHRWFHMFEPTAADEPLSSCMTSAIALVRERREFIKRVHDTGGRVHFTVVLYPPSGREPPFDYQLLTELLDLGIGFHIDVHPRDGYLHDPTDIVEPAV